MSDLFDEKAKDWDADAMIQKLSSAIGTSILEHITFHNKMNVMDFGAGTGLISSHVAPLVNKILAVDISKAMLDNLVSKPEFHGKVEALCQNIINNPIDVQFDLIMSAMALHHIEDTHKLIQTFSVHLKPGAMLALADLDKEDGSFHPKDTKGVFHFGFERGLLQEILSKNGFDNIQFVTAHTINKDDKTYPIFLVTAKKC